MMCRLLTAQRCWLTGTLCTTGQGDRRGRVGMFAVAGAGARYRLLPCSVDAEVEEAGRVVGVETAAWLNSGHCVRCSWKGREGAI